MGEIAKPAPRAPALDVTHVGDGLVMGSVGQICLAIWRKKPSHATFDIQRSTLAHLVAAHPGRALFLCVVEANTDPPDEDIRTASAKMISAHGKALAGGACVIEGSGFRAAITRTVLTGMSLIARPPTPFSYFDSVKAAAIWLEGRTKPSPVKGLEHLVEEARARFDATG